MPGGGAPVPESDGSKKSVDFQLNLIPFIDLLSVLISFLLMTSVWTQVSKIDVRPKPNQGSPSELPADGLDLTILVKANGYELRTRNRPPTHIAKTGDRWDQARLTERLTRLGAEHPDNRKVTVMSEDHVPYQQLISVMDICLAHRLDGISVAGVDG